MNARTVFKVLALVGVPVTGYLASRGAGIKAKMIKEQGVPVTRREKIKDFAIAYGPAIAAGAVTMGSICMSDKLATKAIAVATATATTAVAKKDVLKGQFDKYRGVVKEELGDEKDIEFMSKASKVELDSDGEVLHWFEIHWLDHKPIRFRATKDKVRAACDAINRELFDYREGCGIATVSQFLDHVGYGHLATKDTDEAGWNNELLYCDCDCYWLDFYIHPKGESILAHGDEDTDTFVIDVPWPPYYNLGMEIRQAEAMEKI